MRHFRHQRHRFPTRFVDGVAYYDGLWLVVNHTIRAVVYGTPRQCAAAAEAKHLTGSVMASRTCMPLRYFSIPDQGQIPFSWRRWRSPVLLRIVLKIGVETGIAWSSIMIQLLWLPKSPIQTSRTKPSRPRWRRGRLSAHVKHLCLGRDSGEP